MKLHALLIVVLCTAQFLKQEITAKPRLSQILLEVESQLKSGGALTTSVAFLDSLKAAIDEEQIRHDQLYTKQRNQCALELELRKKDIKDAEQVLNRGNEQLENCTSSYNKARAELDNNLEAQKITDGDLKILQAMRDEGSRLFENKKRDHLDSLTSLQMVLQQLDGFTTGDTSLIQLGAAAMQMISCAVKVTHGDSTLSEMSTILAQVANQNGGYREVYEKLKAMVVNFDLTLQKNLQDYSEVESIQIQEYDERHVQMVEYYNNLKRTEQMLRDHITAMNLCQNQQTAIIDTARGKKVRNTQIFNSADVMCKDFLGEYDKASQVRKDQIDLIDQFKQTLIEHSQGPTEQACPE